MTNKVLQHRKNEAPVSITGRTICGYAAVFYDPQNPGTEFALFDDLAERVDPAAFSRTIAEDDIRGLFNHDSNYVLGRLSAKTLRLSTDAKGLRYEIDLPLSPFAEGLLESIQRRDITGSSFGFYIRSQKIEKKEGGGWVRTILDAQLVDVGPVTFPAYVASSAEVESARSAITAAGFDPRWLDLVESWLALADTDLAM